MATALARRTQTKTKTKSSSSSGRGAVVKRRAAQVVQVVRRAGSRGAAVAKRASQSETVKSLALGSAGAAVTGAVAHKIPLPASVTSKVPTAAIVGAAGVLAGMALKGKARSLVTSIAAGPLYAGAYQLGERAGATMLAGDFDDVGYSSEIEGSSGVAVEGEFDDL